MNSSVVFKQFSQGSDQWYEWRKTGVTATDAIILMGEDMGVPLYQGETPFELWHVKKGLKEPKDLSNNPNVIRGKSLEDAARIAFEQYIQCFVFPLCIENGRLLASLDGYIPEFNEPVELKCPSESTWKKLISEGRNSLVFKRYWIQVQHQLLVTGAEKGHLAFFFDGQLMTFDIKADKEFQDSLKKAIEQFLVYLDGETPPPKSKEADKFVPEGDELVQWLDLSEQLKTALVEKAKWESIEKATKAQLIELKGDYVSANFNGVQITTFERVGALDTDALFEYIRTLDPSFKESVFRKKSSTGIRVTCKI